MQNTRLQIQSPSCPPSHVHLLGKVRLLRRGGGDEDVLKKAHIFTGPLLRLLVNFRCPPLQVFKIFNAPPPLQNSESKE